GIGTTSQALEREFAVTDAGAAKLEDGTATVKLTLTPRHAEVFPTITRVEVWYDTRNWVAAQLQIGFAGGDYDRVRYREMQINPKLNDKVFSIDFPGATPAPH
ncbi:MAG: LolA family protein, partial [Terriglobales bacterium]